MKLLTWIRLHLPLWIPGSTKADLENCAHLPVDQLAIIARNYVKIAAKQNCDCNVITLREFVSNIFLISIGVIFFYFCVLGIVRNPGYSPTSLISFIGALLMAGGTLSGTKETFSRLWHKCKQPTTKQTPQDIIPQFLFEKLKMRVDNLLGDGFKENHRDINRLLRELRPIESYFLGRINAYARQGNSAPGYLLEAHSRAEELIAGLEQKRTDLEMHEAKLKAFLELSKNRIDGLKDPIADHAAIAKLDTLANKTGRLQTQTDHIIAQTAIQLQLTFDEIREECNRMFEQTGIEIAAAQPTVALLEQTVADFVPAEDHMAGKTVH